MIVTPIKTRRVEPSALSLTALLDEAITELAEGSIVVITSKVVSLCEGSAIPRAQADKDRLITIESDKYLGREHSRYNLVFTVTNHTLIPTAGIDESNGADHYVLWPRDPQQTAHLVRSHLVERFGLEQIGVVITDSTCRPMRRGTGGISIAHAGFHATKNYIGEMDLFGEAYKVTTTDQAGMLAAAAVVTMGEGTEQTPLALISDLPFIQFEAAAPDAAELEFLRITTDEDLFAPFLEAVNWLSGQGRATPQD